MLVLGGGPAGLAMAIELCQAAPLAVLVAETGGEPGERHGETVPPDILLLLERLGLTAEFRRAGHLPCPGSVSIWGGARPGHNDFILNPMGPAWHLSRRRFERMLEGRALRAGAVVGRALRFLSAEPVVDATDAGYAVWLDSAIHGRRSIRARWVVDATGSPARFARRQGARLEILDRMVGVARFARLAAGEMTSQTLLEAVADGWWYCARLPDDRLITLLMLEPDEAPKVRADDHRLWRRRLRATRLLSRHLEDCRLDDESFRTFPVVPAFLEPLRGERWLAVGDAASSYDPIAAQGIYKALADARDAAREILAALGHGPPPSPSFAERVAARRRDYLANQRKLYEQEGRWPEARFWRRRQEAAG